jgi:hypothetical protein
MTEEIDWLKPENRFRATPIDLLRQGLQTQNWEAINACYLALTGEKITAKIQNVETSIEVPTKRKRGRPKKVKSISTEDKKEDTPKGIPDYLADCVAPAQDPNQPKKVYAKAKTHDINPASHTNQFIDDGNIATQEIIKDRKVPTSLLEAARQPVQFFKIKCAGCGKKDVVDDVTVAFLKLPENYNMRYLCNNCASGAKSSGGISNLEPVEADE